MTKVINFVLLREGSSDDALVVVLRQVLASVSSAPVLGSTRDYRGTVASKLHQLRAESGQLDLVFVHRDADGPLADDRIAEIRQAAQAVRLPCPVLPLVPIQETEAWLLLDESEIRRVVGNPTGKVPLHLPRLTSVESTPRPKEILHKALLSASETRGRRRQKVTQHLGQHCRQLLDRATAGLQGLYPDLDAAWPHIQRSHETR